nr:response regulator [Pseudoalteromonas phenolica]
MENATVLVVDDVSENLSFIGEVIGDEYRVLAAKSGSVALAILERNEVDIILLDVVMPEMDGYEVITELKINPKSKDIPVIFLTAKSSVEDEKKGFSLGASDYISKPISPPILMARLKTHLLNKRSKDFLKSKNLYLEEVQKRAAQMSELQDVTIQAMASLAETRDEETGFHIKRTQLYVKRLAEELAKLPKYKKVFTKERINIFYKSAPLHDIGKVGIPDSILLKPGKLTENEFEVMKSHAVLGYSAINQAEQKAGTAHDFLEVAKEIALYHHEKWDGSGYPKGISG